MYYLVNAEIFRTFDATGAECENIQRLVKAKDKNTACDKMEYYLDNVYVSRQLPGLTVKYHIDCQETII